MITGFDGLSGDWGMSRFEGFVWGKWFEITFKPNFNTGKPSTGCENNLQIVLHNIPQSSLKCFQRSFELSEAGYFIRIQIFQVQQYSDSALLYGFNQTQNTCFKESTLN